MIEIKQLVKSYGNKEVLHGIDMDVREGEIFGFIGPNGAGKSTTLKCLSGILPFESGSIKVGGYDILTNPMEAKRIMAYLPDNPDIYEGLTGVQFLNFVGDVFGIPSDVRTSRIDELSKELELYGSLGDQVSGYSHGMKQKLALISAFLHDPKILVLDEPFVGLDPKAAFILKEKMRQLCERGSAVLFSSHVLEVVEKLCDRVGILVAGSFRQIGATEDIIADQSLEQVFLELDK
ncbi:MAG: ABC transporter ATP-binding protein [Erysipelotrichales bacterium]|nr:ABC transporter ATP-binding protein [Erysipelotrichales bacterium]MBQ1385412.1 ABC transporter ATP-binding protein [Erysipelotrichales bacterium]MBQ2309507.1 ABC transporter ATP-binding protein [Erysipelotrichales bacterium]MBQ2478720.1 ABC transporter ATP-binding protein [Erysipelotrichales bacterium]MBQ4011957.1 ABC transporter ATP-binding protein [Erysipelotrichales bacterium]